MARKRQARSGTLCRVLVFLEPDLYRLVVARATQDGISLSRATRDLIAAGAQFNPSSDSHHGH